MEIDIKKLKASGDSLKIVKLALMKFDLKDSDIKDITDIDFRDKQIFYRWERAKYDNFFIEISLDGEVFVSNHGDVVTWNMSEIQQILHKYDLDDKIDFGQFIVDEYKFKKSKEGVDVYEKDKVRFRLYSENGFMNFERRNDLSKYTSNCLFKIPTSKSFTIELLESLDIS